MTQGAVTVVGGGLAGCEAAWALAGRGLDVRLVEMRPQRPTPAHQGGRLAELVCSNSFKSTDPTNAHGLLKAELRRLGSLLLPCADQAAVPAGAALAVDRELFSRAVEERIAAQSRITVVRTEASDLPSPGVVATGPLTSPPLAAALTARLGAASLAFYDAIAPIVSRESLAEHRLFARSRYGKGGGDDYLNAPLTRDEYASFVEALVSADQHRGHDFDPVPYFEGCLPVEEMARRGPDTLRFGPMKPVGLADPRTGREPWAVVQLRREDRSGQMWNLVGFQTRLRIPEQQRVLRMIPGLESAEFLRYGSVHRNTYLNAPACLGDGLAARDDPRLFFAGQMTGVEGYTESLGTGLLAGISLARVLHGQPVTLPPPTTMLGALYRYLREADPTAFQPMNANWGLVEPLDPDGPEGRGTRGKDERRRMMVARAEADFEAWRATL